uniref:Uncharacterized protein n=1 Tax=Dunaliella tertiolecta TaxID=3047 RepID=A0A7S3VR46_DUNTE
MGLSRCQLLLCFFGFLIGVSQLLLQACLGLSCCQLLLYSLLRLSHWRQPAAVVCLSGPEQLPADAVLLWRLHWRESPAAAMLQLLHWRQSAAAAFGFLWAWLVWDSAAASCCCASGPSGPQLLPAAPVFPQIESQLLPAACELSQLSHWHLPAAAAACLPGPQLLPAAAVTPSDRASGFFGLRTGVDQLLLQGSVLCLCHAQPLPEIMCLFCRGLQLL